LSTILNGWLSLLEAFHKQSFSAAGLVPTAATILLRSNALIWKTNSAQVTDSGTEDREYLQQLPAYATPRSTFNAALVERLLQPSNAMVIVTSAQKINYGLALALIFTDVSMAMEIASSKGRVHGGGGSHGSTFSPILVI
jgi:hypothetical protein